MRRRDVSPEELARIIMLRQSDTSWLQIQRDTGVSRRIAKRAYEEWGRSQSREELKAARKDVAAEEFRNHLVTLIKLAQLLVRTLDKLPLPSLNPVSAQEILRNLLQEDIAGEYGVYGRPEVVRGAETYPPETCLRQNQILLEALQSHTHEKIDWQILKQWKDTWDDCTRTQGQLRQETTKILLNIFNQKPGLIERIVEGSGREREDVVKRMVDGVLYATWQKILAGKLDQSLVVETISVGHARVEVVFGENHLSKGLYFSENDLAKQVEETGLWVGKNLGIDRKEDMIKLVNDVRKMRGIVDDLTRKLNPLMLRPLILNTRCDLCPA